MTTSPSAEEGDQLDRSTFAIRAEGGPLLGTAVLIEPKRALTCAHVVGDLDRVEIASHPQAEKLCGATIERRGDPEGSQDLALLLLDEEILDRQPIEFVEWTRSETFAAIGFPGRKGQVQGNVHGPSDFRGWLEIDPVGTRKIVGGFSGGAVWIPTRRVAVGLITHYAPDNIAFAITTQQILTFHSIGAGQRETTVLSPEEIWARCAMQVAELRDHLEHRDVREAIEEVDAQWKESGSHAEAFAQELCFETEPKVLAEKLGMAYRAQLGKEQRDTASKIFEVLLDAVTVSLIHRWRPEVPAATTREIESSLRDWLLTELLLAVADGSRAQFNPKPSRKDENCPQATYRLKRPGESGPDPNLEEDAQELALEVRNRLALGIGNKSKSLKRAEDYLVDLATGRQGKSGYRLVSREYMERTEPGTGASAQETREALLRDINRRLKVPDLEAGRRLYFGARKADKELAQGLGRHLPGLRIVSQGSSCVPSEELEGVLEILEQVFCLRTAS